MVLKPLVMLEDGRFVSSWSEEWRNECLSRSRRNAVVARRKEVFIGMTDEDLQTALDFAARVKTDKRAKEKLGLVKDTLFFDNGGAEMMRLGALGEIALSKYLSIQFHDQVTQYGDGGVDLEYRGTGIQVKTRVTKNFSGRRYHYLNKASDFHGAHWLVSCSLPQDNIVCIHGFISRSKFERRMQTVDMGYGQRVTVYDEDLSPIWRIDDAVDRILDPAPARDSRFPLNAGVVVGLSSL